MPTQPYARTFFKLTSGSSTSAESDAIKFPFRRWDEGIVVLAINHKIGSGTDNISVKVRMYYQDVGWTEYYDVYDHNNNKSFSTSTSESVIALQLDRQVWWKVCQGLQIKIETSTATNLEAKCAILAR